MKGEGRRVKKKIDWMIKRNKRMQGINANSGLLIKYTEEYWVSEIIDMFVFGTPCTFSLKFLSYYETNVFLYLLGHPLRLFRSMQENFKHEVQEMTSSR